MGARDLTARPLGLAEVVDRSIAVGLRHFRPLFLAMLGFQGAATVIARQLPVLETLSAVGDPVRAAALLGRAARSTVLVLLALLALQFAATAAAATIVRPSLDSRRGVPRPGRVRATVAVATATLFQVLLLATAPVAGALPGVALAMRARSQWTAVAGVLGALAGGVGLFLVLTLRLMLVPAVAALEGRAGPAALARSSRLMAPHPGGRFVDRPGVRASAVLLAMLVLAMAVNGVAGIPRVVAVHLHGADAGLGILGASLPLPLEIALSLFETVAAAALQPFSLVAVVVLYFDRLARREGLDLELWAERLEGGA